MPKTKDITLPSVLTPVEWALADASAAQALERGEATADQQQRFMAWLMHRACMFNDMEFRTGPDGDRESAFMGGRRFVASQVRKLLLVDIAKLQERENG